VHENRIYSVNIHCGDQYPDLPPTIQFVSRVNLPCVDQKTGKVRRRHSEGERAEQWEEHTGAKHMLTTLACCQVDPSKLPCLANWKRDYTMETILIELRRYV
jgi:ubiquitin-conjugating enzyme E2 variant